MLHSRFFRKVYGNLHKETVLDCLDLPYVFPRYQAMNLRNNSRGLYFERLISYGLARSMQPT